MSEEPALERLQHLVLDEGTDMSWNPVFLGHRDVVLEHLVRARDRVVELPALEPVVVPPRLVARTELGIDCAPHGPAAVRSTLDPDHDSFLRAGVVEPVHFALGEPARAGGLPHGPWIQSCCGLVLPA